MLRILRPSTPAARWYADRRSRPVRLQIVPVGQRYTASARRRETPPLQFCTPCTTATQTRPSASPANSIAVPCRPGVRSVALPPAAATVQTCSGVSTSDFVERNASVFPPSAHAMPAHRVGNIRHVMRSFRAHVSIDCHALMMSDHAAPARAPRARRSDSARLLHPPPGTPGRLSNCCTTSRRPFHPLHHIHARLIRLLHMTHILKRVRAARIRHNRKCRSHPETPAPTQSLAAAAPPSKAPPRPYDPPSGTPPVGAGPSPSTRHTGCAHRA